MAGDDERAKQTVWFQMALDEYEGRLTRYAARLTGDLERARDVVQETFLRLALEQPLNIDGHLAEWLYRICRQRALDVCRKERRMSLFEDTEAIDFVSTQPDPPAMLQQHDDESRLLRSLAALPANQQEVLRLKFQDGLKYREIGEITGLSVSHVGVLIHTAIKKLREQLADDLSVARADLGR
jgi:RNA polymerase sigma factor (sigma-70 family)